MIFFPKSVIQAMSELVSTDCFWFFFWLWVTFSCFFVCLIIVGLYFGPCGWQVAETLDSDILLWKGWFLFQEAFQLLVDYLSLCSLGLIICYDRSVGSLTCFPNFSQLGENPAPICKSFWGLVLKALLGKIYSRLYSKVWSWLLRWGFSGLAGRCMGC